jgi:hypothetical protein
VGDDDQFQTPAEIAAYVSSPAVRTVYAWLDALASNFTSAAQLSTFEPDELNWLAKRLGGMENWSLGTLPRPVTVDIEDIILVHPDSPSMVTEPTVLLGQVFRVHQSSEGVWRVVALVDPYGETFPKEPRLRPS